MKNVILGFIQQQLLLALFTTFGFVYPHLKELLAATTKGYPLRSSPTWNN